MSKIVVVGAGKTGRGFIARLLQEASEEVIFIDKNAELVEALNKEKEFKVSFFGNVREAYNVHNFKACTWGNADLEDAELILVSVGGQNLKDVGASLAPLLNDEKHYYIITAENASHPSKTLKEAIGKDNISVSESTVFCTTIEDGGLDINSENYPYLQCDADLLEGYVPTAKTLKPIEEISIQRISFYRKLGFTLHEKPYLQPPYRKGDPWFPLKLMTYGEIDMQVMYEGIKERIYKEVYNQP